MATFYHTPHDNSSHTSADLRYWCESSQTYVAPLAVRDSGVDGLEWFSCPECAVPNSTTGQEWHGHANEDIRIEAPRTFRLVELAGQVQQLLGLVERRRAA